MDLSLIAGLVAAATAAGFVDSIAGGGGLITVPVLMLAGMTPGQALATNKLQGSFGAATAAVSYGRSGLVDLRRQLPTAALAFAAGGAGAALVTALPTEVLRLALPVVLIGIALFFALKPGLNDLDRAARLSPATICRTSIPKRSAPPKRPPDKSSPYTL